MKTPPKLATHTIPSAGISWIGVPEKDGESHNWKCLGCSNCWTSYWEYITHNCQNKEFPYIPDNRAFTDKSKSNYPTKIGKVREIVDYMDLDEGKHYTTHGGISLTAEGLDLILSELIKADLPNTVGD